MATRNIQNIQTIWDVYKMLYDQYEKDYVTASYFFGDMNDQLLQLFKIKYFTIAKKYETRKINRRLNSAKCRQAWWGQVQSTDDGTITATSVIDKLKAQHYQCVLCSLYLNKYSYKQLDHIKPVSKGGCHTIDNVQWLCRKCNIKKKDIWEDT